MIRVDEHALICDLAETYHIFDYKQLPALQVAILSAGLRDTARIKQIMTSQSVPQDLLLLAGIFDRMNLLLWSKTKDGQSGRNRPISIVEQMTVVKKEKQERSFSSGEEFERVRKQLLQEMR